MTSKIYENEILTVHQSSRYPSLRGCVEISFTIQAWDSSTKSINMLANTLRYIRIFLTSNGVDIVGIYFEKVKDGSDIINVIPFYTDILRKLGFSAEVYQPHIEEYLASFKNESLSKGAASFNESLSIFLKRKLL